MLTDTKVKAATRQARAYRLSDTHNLYLYCAPSGTKTFRLDIKVDGKRKTVTLGQYPIISLKTAREKALQYRQDIANTVQAIPTFRELALRWGAKKVNNWNPKDKTYRRLENYVYPAIGAMRLNEVKARHILQLLHPLESKGSGETAHRVLNIISRVMRYGVLFEYCESDITQNLKGALKSVKKGHFDAVTDEKELALMLGAIRDSNAGIVVKTGLFMLAHVFVRPGELRAAKWQAINFETREWRFVSSKTKVEMIVPLSNQVITLLEELRPYTQHSKYVFAAPKQSDRPISDTTLAMALRRLGFNHHPHGFRATARTLLDEKLHFPAHLIEHQLGHTVKDALGRAYNRTTHLPQRVEMMNQWSNYLESISESRI